MKYGYEGITEFIFMNDEISKVDVILIPGGSYSELAIQAAELYNKGYTKYILPSGGENRHLDQYDTEYDFLKEILIDHGVPESAILIENKAKHTFDNAQLSLQVLREKQIDFSSVMLLCKSFHSRRAYMTYKIYFPREVEFIVCPVVDRRNISKDNWFMDEDKIEIVFTEVKKIGEYFEGHIESMRKEK